MVQLDPREGAGFVQSHPVYGRVKDRTQVSWFPGRLPFHCPTLPLTSVAAASSRLGLCPIHPSSATNLPRHPEEVTHCWVSQFPHLQDGGGGSRDPWSPPNPASSRCPWTVPVSETQTWRWKPAPSPLSTISTCFPLGCCILFIGYVLPD